MNSCKSLSILLLLIISLSCDKPLPTLDGIDARRWEEDKNACKGARSSMRESIEKEKENCCP